LGLVGVERHPGPVHNLSIRGNKLRYFLIASALVLGAVLGGVYYFSDRLCTSGNDDLEQPLAILGSVAFADGGTMKIDFVDAADKRWGIVRVGSLDVEPQKQVMLVVRWVSVVPIRCKAPVGSMLEGKVKRSLSQWLSGRLTEEQRRLLVQGDVETFKAVPPEVVDVWAFANWIDHRR